MIKRFAKSMLLGVLVSTLMSTNSFAETGSAGMMVMTYVPASCEITTTTLNFPNYSGFQVDGAGSIQVVCSNSRAYTVAIDNGSYAAVGGDRRMRLSGGGTTPEAYLTYLVYSDSARATLFPASYSSTGTGAMQETFLYGRIPAGQNAIPGGYADAITATITF